MFTGTNIQSERRRLIAKYRDDHAPDTMGLSDIQVEAHMFGLADVSTEALTYALSQRGYHVALEVG